jgi:cholest-4-en-3-one 26-monooxygenase
MNSACPLIPSFDFLDLDLFAAGHPHHLWQALRLHAPVYWHQKSGRAGFWLITKHADVVTVSRDSSTFSSHRGVGLPGPEDSSAPPDEYLPVKEPFLDLLDPPDHTRMRRLFSRLFTPQALKSLEVVVRHFGNEALDRMTAHGRADLVTDFARRVPLAVLSWFMGLPQDDWRRLAEWTELQTPDFSSDQIDPERAAASAAGLDELSTYLSQVIRDHEREPRGDLIGQLLMLEGDGQLTHADVMRFCLLLIGVGHETTREALCGGMVALLEHSEQLLRLRRDPSLVDTMVEEILRWTSPVVFFGRFVTRDATLSDQKISAGERVITVFPAANFDEEVFAAPNQFDVGREPNDHVAFGAGHHFCLGAALARLQLRTLIPLVFERLPKVELAGTPQRTRSNFLIGYSHVPIRF